MGSSGEAERPDVPWLKAELRQLYHGQDPRSVRFRWTLFVLDLVTVGLFVEMTFVTKQLWMIVLEMVLGVLILLELLARLYIAPSPRKRLIRLSTWVDVIVIISLLAAPFAENLGFFRILRALRLFRSPQVLGSLRRVSPFVRERETSIVAASNLFVFVFFVAGLVFVTQADRNQDINTFLDALYFTVTTLTTTGFGDIVLVGEWGRLLAIAIMIVGLALFLRLLQTVFQPPRAEVECRKCGLARHDRDAVHCKHCGEIIHIDTEGSV
ncbi:MAG: two pore domain potassium channel family protein [Geminicoccaceae bacterium]|nr:MAG: two pore domain potassium channel family protein [Geminicoccaceae bacterium]